jgi:hypothetical protein
MSDLASWIEAIGTVGSLAVAVVLWRADHKRKKEEVARENRERVERMLIALKTEIDGAMSVARRQKYTVDRTLVALAAAVQAGKELKGGQAVPGDSMTITDAIVFRAMAPEFGRLPAEVIRNTTTFYTMTRELERLALMGDALTVFRQLSELLPRLLVQGDDDQDN